MSDKNIEQSRYDERAQEKLIKKNNIDKNITPLYLMPPISSYYSLLREIKQDSKVLEIGAGMGENTELMLLQGLEVIASDISPKSVEVMKNKFTNFINFSSHVVDMENLIFEDNTFDIVCSAGSLSYGDNVIVMNEIYRVLKTGGQFIALDSLSNNPIYNLNRLIHHFRGNRSKSTLERMPNIKLITRYEKKFGHVDVRYFGSITWLFPFLKIFLSDNSINTLSNKIDKLIKVRRSAFKFSMKVTKL